MILIGERFGSFGALIDLTMTIGAISSSSVPLSLPAVGRQSASHHRLSPVPAPEKASRSQAEAPGRGRAVRRDDVSPPTAVRDTQAGSPPRARAEGPSLGTTTLFTVQLLGQDRFAEDQPGLAPIDNGLGRHGNGPALGSSLYQRAGGQPNVLSDGATFLRLAV